MKNFYSLSKYPGKTGETYYRKFFALKNLSYSYSALACHHLEQSVDELKRLDASGFSVSMPYKTEIIKLLDHVDPLVSRFNSCNTVLNNNGVLTGYNTDYYGAENVLANISLDTVSILGDGAMGMMFKLILSEAQVYSRKRQNWDLRYNIRGTVINCTNFGTATTESPFESLPDVQCVVDLAIASNDLKKQCESRGIKYIAGIDFYRTQFRKQFEIYTGIVLEQKEIHD